MGAGGIEHRMTFEEYSKHFSSASDRVLVELFDLPQDADPAAVAAAREELARRNLPESVLAELRSERKQVEEGLKARRGKIAALSSKASSVITEVGQTLMVDPAPARSEKRYLRFMIIGIGVMFVSVCPRFADFPWLLEGSYDLSMLEHFLPVVLLPVTLYLLWKRKPAGWYLGAAFTAYQFFGGLILGYLNWDHEPSGLLGIDTLFPVPSRTETLASVLYSAGLVAAFQLSGSMSIFDITERGRWLTLLAVLSVELLLVAQIFG